MHGPCHHLIVEGIDDLPEWYLNKFRGFQLMKTTKQPPMSPAQVKNQAEEEPETVLESNETVPEYQTFEDPVSNIPPPHGAIIVNQLDVVMGKS